MGERMLKAILKIFAIIVLINIIATIARTIVRKQMPSVGDEQSEELDLLAFMDGIQLKSNATEFRGGTVRAVFGGIDLDLGDVELDSLGASLDVRAIFGGVRLFVPTNVRVEITKKTMAGGIDDLTDSDDGVAEGPVLYLATTAIMGGIQVLQTPQDSAFEELAEVS